MTTKFVTEKTQFHEKVLHAAELLKKSSSATALTGAGISTPSGIPDFRSAGSGLWARYLPNEVASINAFRKHPLRFFEWLRPLASHMINAEPNPAHIALAEMEKQGLIKTIITQNIDILHHKAGSKNILEVHGTLKTLTCIQCFNQYPSEQFIAGYISDGIVPVCPICGHYLKPDVILYGEQLPAQIWLEAKHAAETTDLMIIAGSSLTVMPVASLPMMAIKNSAQLIIINHMPTYMDDKAAVVFQNDVAEVLPAIIKEALR